MIKKAVIDRFEGQQAVLLVEEQRVVVSREFLPEKAKEGDWLQVDLEGEQVSSATLDTDETKIAAERIMEKLERLRKGEHKK